MRQVTVRGTAEPPRFEPCGLARQRTGSAAPLSNMRGRGGPDRRSYPAGAPPCRIYQPSASVMQSGGRRTRRWVLEFDARSPPWIEPLMGWTASEDPWAQIRLKFPELASAVDYAERQGLDYQVIDPPTRGTSRRQHSDPNRELGAWTALATTD